MSGLRLDALLSQARKRLSDAGIAGAADDSRRLVAGLLDLSITDLIVRGDMTIAAADAGRVLAAIDRRAGGMPVHRILGVRAFHGVELSLSPETLEPRPDTEALVELALAHRPAGRADLRILDLGTGTGAILLSLLAALPGATGLGVDLSSGAVDTARANAAANGLGKRAEFAVSDWFSSVSGNFDMILSNPPYIRSEDIAGLSREVREHDPMLALDGGPDGLEPYRLIAAQARPFLGPGGMIAVEHGHDQAASVRTLFLDAGFRLLAAARDHGGNDRALAFG